MSDNENTKLVLSILESIYKFPKQWTKQRGRELEAPGHLKDSVSGTQLLNQYGDPFMVLISGNPSGTVDLVDFLNAEYLSSANVVAAVLRDIAKNETRFYRSDLRNKQFIQIPALESFRQGRLDIGGYRVHGNAKGPVHTTQSPQTSQIPLSDNFENVFFEAHSHIRDIDGLHPDEALDELCKFIFIKIYDERAAADGSEAAFVRGLYGTSYECASSMQSLYRRAVTNGFEITDGEFPILTNGIFKDPILLSPTAISKLVETLEPFNLTKSGIDVKGRAFQKVLSAGMRAGMGQYFTPLPVIEFIVEAMNPSPSDKILDPFAGSGHFLTSSYSFYRKKLKRRAHGAPDSETSLYGIEKSPRMTRVAFTDMCLHESRYMSVSCEDALLDFSNYTKFYENQFDLVMTNPPFGSNLNRDSIDQLGDFELAAGRKKIPLEIVGLERSIQFLKPGGRLAIVLPESIFSNKSLDYVRKWLAKNLKILGIVSLPAETFAPYGANIKTGVLMARKLLPGEILDPEKQKFISVEIENIGYESSGLSKSSSDIDSAIKAVKTFIDKYGW